MYTKAKSNFKKTILQQILLLQLFVLFSGTVLSQSISFEKLGLKDGLSEAAGLCIHQDHLNRMWIGTRNGLNCWDGVRMKRFFPERGNTASLMEHKIADLRQLDNYLWARSSKGLSRLNLTTMSFKRFYIDGIESIGNYANTILVGTSSGLLVYNKKTELFEKAETIFSDITQTAAIYEDKNNTLWLANEHNSELIRIKDNTKEIIKIPVRDNLLIYDLLAASDSNLWIATRYHGILVYHIKTKSFEYINENSKPYYVEDLSVRDLIEDKEGRLWVGTFKGLAIFDLNKKTTSLVHASKRNPHSLSHNSVYSLYLSNDNNIWVGTYFGGINYGKISNNVFQKYDNIMLGQHPSNPVIGSLIEDQEGNIWIATEGGGIDYFDRQKGTFTNYPYTGDGTGLSQSNIKSLLLTDDKIFAGTYQGGLNILDLKKKEIKHYNKSDYKNSPNHVNATIKYKDNFLLGTEKGVLQFNPKTEQFKPFFISEGLPQINNTVTVLFKDTKGLIWIGFEYAGLMVYNPETKALKKYTFDEFDTNTISYNSINYIMEDHRFRIWIGTDGGGLCLYKRNTDNFASFNQQKNNLPSDFVYGITESRFGNLWIATSKGLSRFDVENNLFFNYTSESGFPLTELNYKALLLTNSGELFVGGIDGLISFKERDLLLGDEGLQVNFSSLYVNNEEVWANDATKILDKDISVAESFILKPKHTSFVIHFSSFNYNSTLNNKYQYQLLGFNEDWVNSEFTTSATYTNLNPGTYTFKIRATDVAYNPITEEKSIEITVKPPLSRTWYAYTFYIIITLALILLFNNFYLGKVRVLYQLKNARAEKSRLEELNVHKLRFFTNISHEFMTPLTIILSSLENAFAKYKIPTKLQWQLNLALRNAKRLKNLNSELLDFRKIEQGHLKLKVQENDIVPYLQEIHEAFEGLARNKEIKYNFSKNVNHLSIFYDAAQMDKVFYNLLSNAINHVPEKNGEITIKLTNKTESIEISVIDNGNGIPKEDLEKVFNRFFQHDSQFTDSQYHGSGIGLALSQSIVKAHSGTIICESEEKKGTTFTVILLKGNKHIAHDQLSDKKRSNQFSIDKELIAFSENVVFDDDLQNHETANDDAPLLLIVDDNSEIRYAVKNLFLDSYRIKTANNGLEGLELAVELQPDIIISDVLMPKLSGFDMCKKLKYNLNTSHIPILLLTALDSEEDQTIAFKHGADSYCTKPFHSEMLKARVENLFKNRENLQKKYSTAPGANTKSVTQNIVDRDFLNKAQKIIEKNLLTPEFNVDQFAAEMQMGRTLFYSKVKSITGQTPNEYIQTIRLKMAADMLINTPAKNVSEIAYDIGFNSPRYFAIAFKKHFGVNPSKYVTRE